MNIRGNFVNNKKNHSLSWFLSKIAFFFIKEKQKRNCFVKMKLYIALINTKLRKQTHTNLHSLIYLKKNKLEIIVGNKTISFWMFSIVTIFAFTIRAWNNFLIKKVEKHYIFYKLNTNFWNPSNSLHCTEVVWDYSVWNYCRPLDLRKMLVEQFSNIFHDVWLQVVQWFSLRSNRETVNSANGI